MQPRRLRWRMSGSLSSRISVISYTYINSFYSSSALPFTYTYVHILKNWSNTIGVTALVGADLGSSHKC